MPSESLEILIEADDKATPKIDAVVDNVDAKVKRIKEVGERAKASTEIIATAANVAGGSQLAGALGPLSALIEKVSAFAEVSKAGGAGALAFKAGIAGIVAVGAFKIGDAIGNAVFQTKKWTDELTRATQESKRLDAALGELLNRDFQLDLAEIQLLDPKKQKQELQQLLAGFDKQIADQQKRIQAKRNREETNYEAWFLTPMQLEALRDTTSEEARLAVIREQRQEIQNQLDPRRQQLELDREAARELQSQVKSAKDYISSLETEIAMLGAVTDAERIRIEVMSRFANVDAETRDRIEALMSEKMELENIARAEREAEAEAKRRADEAERNQKRIIDLRQSELDKIEEQRILLTQGKDAARQFALEKQGLSEIDAADIVRKERELEKLRGTKSPDLQATEGRLMTRGRTVDSMERSLRVQERTAKAVEELNSKTKQGGNTLTLEKVML